MPIKDVIIEIFKKYEDRNCLGIAMEWSLFHGLLCALSHATSARRDDCFEVIIGKEDIEAKKILKVGN